MLYIVQKRDYPQQMQSIFHHSLIKMVVMHQIHQKDIPWETFIANEVFTSPQAHHHQNETSSSHPPIHTPPSPHTDHVSPSTHIPSPHDDSSTSPSTHIPSPQDNPPSSPSHNPSPSSHGTSASNNKGDDNEESNN